LQFVAGSFFITALLHIALGIGGMRVTTYLIFAYLGVVGPPFKSQ